MNKTVAGATTGGRRVLLGVTMSALLLSACGGGAGVYSGGSPDFQVATRWASFADDPRLVDDGWLRSFGNSRLVALVNEALANNRDIRIAAARLAEAQARARQAGAEAVPSLDASLQGRSRENADDTVGLGLDVSWEADLWGRISGARRAAALDALSQAALYEAARQSIAAQVVQSWIAINRNRMLIDVTQREVAQRQQFLNDVQARVAEQATLAVDANRAQADLALARARLASQRGALPQSIRALEVLLGRYPAGTLETSGRLPPLPPRPAVGLPSQLLERRPDVVAAEREVAAAFYRRSEAQAARLPRLTLSGELTSSEGSLGAALDPDNIVWNIVGGLIAPILDGGRLQEQVRIATARQAAALASYGETALTAFREVENALTAEQALQRELGFLSRAERELRAAISLEEDRYLLGEIVQSIVSDARLSYYNVLRSQIDLQAELLANRVELYLALGGSFAVPASAAAPDAVVVAVVE